VAPLISAAYVKVGAIFFWIMFAIGKFKQGNITQIIAGMANYKEI
jgi:hypothetical protein